MPHAMTSFTARSMPTTIFSTRPQLLIAAALVVAGCDGTEQPGPGSVGGDGGTAGAGGMTADGGGGSGGQGGTAGQGGCAPSLPTDSEPPETLSATGLYEDIGSKQHPDHVQPFAPAHELWSDDADKQRWIYIPECEQITTSDMNDWSLPVGTRMWKEFRVGGARIETRLIERTGAGPHDFIFAAYLWDDGETEAHRVPEGQLDAKGTNHDVPDESACRRCHGSHEQGGGRPSRALGFSALQLSHDEAGVTIASLVADGRLTDPPATDYSVPGDAAEQAALGYLHANCGHCHNDTTDGVPQLDMNLWLGVDETTVSTTATYLTAVGQPNTTFNDQNVTARIEPGDPSSSAVWFRMNQRGNNAQMPPLASEATDPDGIAAVETWITNLP